MASNPLRHASASRDLLTFFLSVIPSHYDLTLQDLRFAGYWDYQGVVKISLDIKDATDSIVVNTVDLLIKSATLETESKTLEARSTSYEEKKERTTFIFDESVRTGPAILTIIFSGLINTKLCGFSRARYKPVVQARSAALADEEWHYTLSTQFESTDARRAFPCFDEPNLKATFSMHIETADDLVAVSNMPAKTRVQLE
ncbi:hypothetical protein MRB53_041867 [Persea americana]|nr:hypothetical protein MRB53_041867 [Persea americana]